MSASDKVDLEIQEGLPGENQEESTDSLSSFSGMERTVGSSSGGGSSGSSCCGGGPSPE
jgi:hypothetical protein